MSCCQTPSWGAKPNLHVGVLDFHPEVKKAVTKSYEDGRKLNFTVVDDKIVQRMMTYKYLFDYEALKKEKEESIEVSFQ
jgi:hypothetical protein